MIGSCPSSGTLRASTVVLPRLRSVIVAAGGLALAPGHGLAQAARGSAVDSLALRERAEAAQTRFERSRVRRLPTVLSRGRGECDDVVGRMCWRHEAGSLWTPEAESPEVTAARESFLLELAEIGSSIPGDGWLLGQRVWYTGEAGRWPEARRMLQGCSAEPWWCDALTGLVAHAEGRYQESDRAFERALGAMDPALRERWLDLGMIVDAEARRYLEDAGDDARDRFWLWSDPLYLVPGNDRRTAHFSRWVVASIRAGAENPYGMRWGEDMAELLVRYGWAVAWERSRDPLGAIGDRGHVVGHEHPESRTYVPPGEVLRHLGRDEDAPEGWGPEQRYAPSAYAPRYATRILPMATRTAVFPRTDSAVLVATIALPEDTTTRSRRGRSVVTELPAALRSEQPRVGVFAYPLEPDGAAGGQAVTGSVAETRALSVGIREGPHLVSVESWDPARSLAGRHRTVVAPRLTVPGVATVSDLVFLQTETEPASLSEAVPLLVADRTFSTGSSVRIGWEVTGLGSRREELGYSVSLRRAGGGLFNRLGRAIGVVDEERPERLAWTEPGPDTTRPVFRSIVVQLPATSEGEYVLRLEIDIPGRTRIVTERRVALEAASVGTR